MNGSHLQKAISLVLKHHLCRVPSLTHGLSPNLCAPHPPTPSRVCVHVHTSACVCVYVHAYVPKVDTRHIFSIVLVLIIIFKNLFVFLGVSFVCMFGYHVHAGPEEARRLLWNII